jgi:hypothetical protein
MEVGTVNHFGSAGINPEFLHHGLTVRAASVAAGIVVNLLMSAFIAYADIAAQGTGLTCHDGSSSLKLFV